MKSLITLIALTTSLLTFAQDQRILVDKVVGIVGDKIILYSDLELQYQQYSLEGEVPENFRCTLLDQMFSQKMLLEQALVDSIVVSEDEIESELSRRIRYFVSMIGSEEKLEDYYGKSIIEIRDEFRTDIEEQLLSQRMSGSILEGIKVTPYEVKEFYNDIPEDSLPFFNAEVEVGHIVVFPEIDKAQRQLAIEKLEGIRQRVVDGEDFYSLALIYSEDPGSVDQGGDLGYVKRGEMVPEFEAAAFQLEKEEVSPIVKTQFGYHIVQLLDKKGEKARIRHILIKPQVTSFDLKKASAKLDSIKGLLEDKFLAFGEVANLFSEDEGSKHQGGMIANPSTGSNYFEIDQLDKSTYFAIDEMIPGSYSEPTFYQAPDGRQGYRIVYLKSETEAHKANLQEDYARIKAAAAGKKEEKAMLDWLKERIPETYIHIDDSYLECANMHLWFESQKIAQRTYE